RQLGRLLEGGVQGIFLLGSTGEQPALRQEERRRAVTTARDAVGGRVPVVVGTMASGTGRAIENIKLAAEAGADAVAVTPPHYYPTHGEAEQVAHYRACAAASRGAVVIYNIPSTTKVMPGPETLARIAALPGVVGIKDSSGDFGHFLRLLEAMSGCDDFACLVGSPPLLGAAVLFGASGAVPGVANIEPQTLVALYHAASEGRIEETRALQRRVMQLMRIVQFGPPIAC